MRHHQKTWDATPLDALNRIFHESSPEPAISEHSCDISKVSLTAAELKSLRVAHSRIKPYRSTDPIVVVRWRGVTYVVDGNRRVNTARSSPGNEGLDAIVIHPRSDSGTAA